jgi:hypothetical protein
MTKKEPLNPLWRRTTSGEGQRSPAEQAHAAPATDASLPPSHSDGTVTCPRVIGSVASYVQRRGSGAWRVPADLVEATLDALIDRILDPSCTRPDSLIAYAIGICRKLRNDPPIVALDRRRTSSLRFALDDFLADPRDDDSHEEIHLEWLLREVPADLSPFDLTPAQALVVRECVDASSWRVVEERTGMTRRDAKNRLDGAAKKIRRILQEIGPPPNKG